jgi:hypothetical protein
MLGKRGEGFMEMGEGGGGIWGWKEAAEESPIFFPRVSQLCL